VKPTYKLNDFLVACKVGIKDVVVLKTAKTTALQDFKLRSDVDTLSFIGNGGIHGLEFDKSKAWKNNPDPINNPIQVDSYDFFAGSSFGYLAFMFQPFTKKWLLKSFKKNQKPDPRNQSTLGLAFSKALQQIKEEK
jgi:hypothetical protein